MDSYSSFLREHYKSDDFKVIPLAGDASSRRYYRVVHQQETAVLMSWEPFNPTRYPFLSVLQHFKKNKVRTPEVLGMAPELGFVLLEDLGDLTLERKFWENQNPETSLKYYRQAIDELIKMHFMATNDRSECTAFEISFDTEKLLWELNYGRQHLLEKICQWKPSEKLSDEVQSAFTSIAERLHQEPKYIAHRDYHSRNIMIKYDEARVIDFQDARMGPVQYDLVSLLKDSYVDMSDEMADALLADYLDKAKPYLPGKFSKEHFFEIYELQSIQRCFKACGSFSSFLNLRDDRRYLKYIHHTLKRVLKSLSQFPEYKVISDVIIDSGSLDQRYESL